MSIYVCKHKKLTTVNGYVMVCKGSNNSKRDQERMHQTAFCQSLILTYNETIVANRSATHCIWIGDIKSQLLVCQLKIVHYLYVRKHQQQNALVLCNSYSTSKAKFDAKMIPYTPMVTREHSLAIPCILISDSCDGTRTGNAFKDNSEL